MSSLHLDADSHCRAIKRRRDANFAPFPYWTVFESFSRFRCNFRMQFSQCGPGENCERSVAAIVRRHFSNFPPGIFDFANSTTRVDPPRAKIKCMSKIYICFGGSLRFAQFWIKNVPQKSYFHRRSIFAAVIAISANYWKQMFVRFQLYNEYDSELAKVYFFFWTYTKHFLFSNKLTRAGVANCATIKIHSQSAKLLISIKGSRWTVPTIKPARVLRLPLQKGNNHWQINNNNFGNYILCVTRVRIYHPKYRSGYRCLGNFALELHMKITCICWMTIT